MKSPLHFLKTILRVAVIGGPLVAFLLAGCGKQAPADTGAVSNAVSDPLYTKVASAPVAPGSHTVAAGKTIEVESNSVIDSGASFAGEFAVGTVSSDVIGTDGQLAIPAGSSVVMVIREADKKASVSRLTLSLYSLGIGGHDFPAGNNIVDPAKAVFTEDSGSGARLNSVHIARKSQIIFKLDSPLHFN